MINLVCYLLLAAGSGYIAVLYESASFAALFLAELGYLLFAYIWILCGTGNISAVLDIPIAMIEAGGTAKVKLRLSQKIPFFTVWVKVAVGCHSTDCASKGKNVVKMGRRTIDVAVHGKKQANTALYIPLPYAGGYRVFIKRLRLYDPLGILYLPCRVKKKEGKEAFLTVLPKLCGVSVQLGEAARHFYGEGDVYDEEKAGDDPSEVFQIREFLPGDKVQSIHWKLSARTGELMIREHGMPKGCPVVLLLDKTWRYKNLSMQNACYSILSSIGYSLLEANCSFYLAWRTDRIHRLRVDKEESLYEGLVAVLQSFGKWERQTDNLLLDYRQQYPGENYVAAFILTNELHLCKARQKEPESQQNPPIIASFCPAKLEEQLDVLDILV